MQDNKFLFLISGTPGTGKTTIAEKLEQNGFEQINFGEFAKNKKAFEYYDETTQSYVIDEQRLISEVTSFLKSIKTSVLIIEGHYVEIVPSDFVTKCFVLTTPIEKLKIRLTSRGYSESKIKENLQAEIMQICFNNAIESFGFDNIRKISDLPIQEIVDLIIEEINSMM